MVQRWKRAAPPSAPTEDVPFQHFSNPKSFQCAVNKLLWLGFLFGGRCRWLCRFRRGFHWRIETAKPTIKKVIIKRCRKTSKKERMSMRIRNESGLLTDFWFSLRRLCLLWPSFLSAPVTKTTKRQRTQSFSDIKDALPELQKAKIISPAAFCITWEERKRLSRLWRKDTSLK